MNQKNTLLPGIVLRSIAGGMILMALLTFGWTLLATTGLYSDGVIWLAMAGILALFLIICSVYFFIVSKHFPKLESTEDKAEGKRMSKWYGIIFGGEGVLIGGACAALSLTGHLNYIIPTAVLIIGIHFLPMAPLFRRTVDYYIGTWTCLVAITGLYLVFKGVDPGTIHAFTGFGAAFATAAYGLYMIFAGNKIIRTLKTFIENPVKE